MDRRQRDSVKQREDQPGSDNGTCKKSKQEEKSKGREAGRMAMGRAGEVR